MDIVVPNNNMWIYDLDTSGAFHILNTLLFARDFLLTELGYAEGPTPNWAIWDVQDNSDYTSSFARFFANGVPGFYIASRANYLVNWDEWDESVVIHEYGHYVMYSYMQRIPGASGIWYYLFPVIGNNLVKALSEGFAHFFSSIVLNSPSFLNSTVQNPLWEDLNFELPIPDPPYYNSPSEIDPLQPPRIAPQYEGAHIVGAVTVALWDIFDNPDDDDYYVFSTIWGHNNDHNGVEIWKGIDAIWDVLTNFDPQPDNSAHEHCWNVYEFIHGWRSLGYPMDSIFKNIFEAHNVPVFVPGNVDNSGDDQVDIDDLVYLVNWGFGNPPGPPPVHLSAADVDANCDNDIGDVTYLVDYMFGNPSGPAPLAGCVDLY